MPTIRLSIPCIFTAALLLAAAVPCGAQWVENGTPVAATPEYQAYPKACPDGEGGMIAVWQDTRASIHEDIYAQRLDSFGREVWASGGIVVCDSFSIQSHPQIAPDGQGGAVMVWWDQRGGSSDIYAQRIDADGNAVWADGGVKVFGYSYPVSSYAIDGDGQGGAVISWYDKHEDYVTNRVYVQRLAAADGSRLWGTDGTAAANIVSDQSFPDIVATGGGGAWVVWADGRNSNWDIYIQWVKASGTLTWSSGVGVCTAVNQQRDPVAISDGGGGMIVAWQDMRNDPSYYDIYAAGLDTSLTYTMYDVPVCVAGKDQIAPVLAPDGQGGAFVAWQDERPSFGSDVYAQRISPGSIVEWATDGIAVCDEGGWQHVIAMTADGYGGAVLAWSDSRVADGGADLYAHRLEPTGLSDWTAGGVLLCEQPPNKTAAVGGIVPDGLMGGIAVWHDNRSPDWDIYAQRVERAGNWGFPCAAITGAEDVPFDQGGQLTLTWDASRLDVFPDETVTHYSVWRSLDEKSLGARLDAGVEGVRLEDVTADFTGPAILLGADKAAGAWEWVANQPAHWLAEYAYTAATVNDSIDGNPGWHHFFVSSHTGDAFLFWDSLPDSGYSVDNLAPAAPAGLAGEADFDPLSLHLAWRPNTEPDLAGYRVYRGTDAGFVPGAGNLLAAVADTASTDGGWTPMGGYHYKVTALDIHGNESPWAYLAPAGVSGQGGTPAAVRPFLASHPNPFNPQTVIAYALASPAEVVLRIFDARGCEVAVIREGRRTAGRHEAAWDGRDAQGRSLASGMYFCRLEAGALKLVHKMSLVR